MLRENPSYAQLYLQIALEEIYEDQGIPAYLIALRQVIESRGGIGEIETLTCYNGIKGDGCGQCAACNLRANGLNHYLADKAGVMAAMQKKTGLK